MGGGSTKPVEETPPQNELTLILKRASTGDAASQFTLGSMYISGVEEEKGIKQDIEAGLEWLRKAAAQGHVEANFSVGQQAEQRADYQTALAHYKIAADKGHVKANFHLGTFYLRGSGGIETDLDKALIYLTTAADMGDAEAQFYVAWCYHYDNRIKKDMEKALCYYKKAASQNHGNALNNLGECYHYGEGVVLDREKAAEYFMLSAAQKTGIGYLNIGVYYYFGYSNNLGRYLTKSVEYYQKAADSNVSAAFHNLGWCYHNGLGVEKDMVKAVHWYQKAVDKNEAGSLCNLGWCYLYGEGVAEDVTTGLKYIRRSVDGQDAAAIAILGFCHEWGKGVECIDMEEAIKLYEKSALKKNVWGLSNLARVYEEGKSIEKDLIKAKELYDAVEECDDPDLLCMLAESYDTGKAVVRNTEKKRYILNCVAMKAAGGWPSNHKHLPDSLKMEVEETLLCMWAKDIPVELQVMLVRRAVARYHLKKN